MGSNNRKKEKNTKEEIICIIIFAVLSLAFFAFYDYAFRDGGGINKVSKLLVAMYKIGYIGSITVQGVMFLISIGTIFCIIAVIFILSLIFLPKTKKQKEISKGKKEIKSKYKGSELGRNFGYNKAKIFEYETKIKYLKEELKDITK